MCTKRDEESCSKYSCRASVVKGEETSQFREVAGVYTVAAGCLCSTVDTSTFCRALFIKTSYYATVGKSNKALLHPYFSGLGEGGRRKGTKREKEEREKELKSVQDYTKNLRLKFPHFHKIWV